MTQKLNNIPTNVITGFLGVGKTTAIQHLLNYKPENERWAVLVNEFGEVGIDASLVSGNYSEDSGVYLREVPGGCMCCASGLPMQIALNVLLNKAKPDRLLIEPTGLGHPKEVLAVLSSDYYRDVLDIRATLTLFDARKLSDERYLNNEVFQQQLAIADRLVANKADLYQAQDFSRIDQFVKDNSAFAKVALSTVQHGALELSWLDEINLHLPESTDAAGNSASQGFVATTFAPKLPECGFLRIDNRGQGFNSCGWLFDADFIFDRRALDNVLMGVNAVRLKGVFITNDGVIGYNMVDEVMSSVELDDAIDSRIEVIASGVIDMDRFETELLSCIVR